MKKAIIFLFIISGFFLFPGCEDFLEEDPKSFSAAENVIQSKKGMEQALMGIYDAGRRLYRNRYYIMMYGITSDGMDYLGSNSSRVVMQNFVFTPENGNLERGWRTNVYAINRANVLLANLPETLPGDQDFLDLVRAEARFLRGWHYFCQVQSYGRVPLMTEENYDELFPANAEIADIYEQIIADLQAAIPVLPGWQENPNVGRPTRGAAKSLLGKVYLTRATSEAGQASDYQSALTQLEDVINNEGYGLWDDYNDAFIPPNDNGKEDIFSIQFVAGTRWNNSLYTNFANNPDLWGLAGYRNFSMSDSLAWAFDPGDERFDLVWWGAYKIDGDTTTYYTRDGKAMSQKFRDPTSKTRSDHGTNLPIIRYSDVLMMAAEAINEINGGPNGVALGYLNDVRTRSDLQPLPGSLNKAEFLKAIQDERWKEFHGEGVRWFDLKRWGILKERVEWARAADNVTVTLPKHSYFPIPQEEVDANENLEQNPGY